MGFFQYILRELAVLTAFVVLGSLLLISIWVSQNVSDGILAEFRHDQVSVVLEPEQVDAFKAFVNQYPGTIRYKISSSDENREDLEAMYPELITALKPLSADFFPISATITVQDASRFLSELENGIQSLGSRIIHRPPEDLKIFLEAMTGTFIGLWILALVLLLYFQVERASIKESQRWSLFKMLGASPLKVFVPIYWAQLIRVLLASGAAVLVTYAVATRIQGLFDWNWPSPSFWLLSVFVFLSVVASSILLFSLFLSKYRRVPLG